MGDGGSGGDPENRAQDRGTLLGKLLSIDVDGGDGKPALAAIGLRNPWRFSFSPDGSQILIGDVGQNAWEEIDRAPFPLPDNANFGWRLLEGTHEFADGGAEPEGYIPPVFEYSHDEGGCSVTGGVEIGGVYLFGDYCSSKYWVLVGDKTTPVDARRPGPRQLRPGRRRQPPRRLRRRRRVRPHAELSRHTPARLRGASKRGV